MTENDRRDGERWTIQQLHEKLGLFEQELRAAGLADNTIRTYVDRSDLFLRWLVGEYEPQGPRR